MPSPVEFRQYLRLFTLADARNGVNPVRLPAGPQNIVQLYAPPSLQYRYKERIPTTNGAAETVWSEWTDVQFVREGDFHIGDVPVDEDTIRQ